MWEAEMYPNPKTRTAAIDVNFFNCSFATKGFHTSWCQPKNCTRREQKWYALFFPDSMVRVHTVFTLNNFTLHCWQGIMFPWQRKEKRTCGIAFSVDREIKVNSGDTLRCMCYLPRWSLRIFRLRCVQKKIIHTAVFPTLLSDFYSDRPVRKEW